MANTRQSKKRIIQSSKHRERNVAMRSMYRTHIKKVLTACESKDQAKANEAFKDAQIMLDKMVTKGIIHKNKSARHKSRLSAKIKAIA
ncbi:MAG: 30S ribosomal protein S20 [Gammaproteobacteria bacterium]